MRSELQNLGTLFLRQIFAFSPSDSSEEEIEDWYSDNNYFEDRFLINYDDLYILDLRKFGPLTIAD